MDAVYLLFEGIWPRDDGPLGGAHDLVDTYRSLESAQGAASDSADWSQILEIIDGRPERYWECVFDERWAWVLMPDER